MKNQDGCKLIAERKNKTSRSKALGLAAGLALALPGAGVNAIGEPIPGIDIVVKKNPGPVPVTLPIDASGRFSLRLTEPGQYTISTACRLPGGCVPHTLSFDASGTPGADGTRPIAILIGLLLPAQKASTMTYDFTVGDRPVVLGGEFQSTAGVRVAAGDVNGDGVEEARTSSSAAAVAPTTGGSEPRFKIAENESPRPVDRLSGATGAGIDDSKRATADLRFEAVGTSLKGTAPSPTDGAGKLPSTAGTPTANTPVSLESDSGSVKASTKTDAQGAFQFTKLPAGKYKLSIADQPARPVTVGAGGAISGKLKHGSGSMHDVTFDTVIATVGDNRIDGAARNPVTGFGSGNTFGFGGPFGSGAGGGMFPGGAMGPGNPMSPGGAMGGAGMGKR